MKSELPELSILQANLLDSLTNAHDQRQTKVIAESSFAQSVFEDLPGNEVTFQETGKLLTGWITTARNVSENRQQYRYSTTLQGRPSDFEFFQNDIPNFIIVIWEPSGPR